MRQHRKPELSKRHHSEKKFHDAKAEKTRQDDFYNQGALQQAHEILMQALGDLQGKDLLDLGCGVGTYSIYYSKKGARVVGLDISTGALSQAKRLAIRKTPEGRIVFVVGSGENIPFRQHFDVIVGVAILHHLDLDLAVRSIEGSLKSGGIAVFMEPLAHNPIINIFRKFTPQRRTKDERPLRIESINALRSDFREVNIYAYGFLSLLSFIIIPFKNYSLFRKVNAFLSQLDHWILKCCPWLQKFCWGAVLQLKK